MAGATQFTITLQLEDSKTQTPVHFKVDGRRFGDDPDYSKTLKFNNTIKYKATVTIAPNVEHLKSLVLGSDEMIPDKEKELGRTGTMLYEFAWITTGYSPTTKGKRNMLKIAFYFDNGTEVTTQMQCKFYGLNAASHVTWGTPLHKLEFICDFDISLGQSHTPKEIKFK